MRFPWRKLRQPRRATITDHDWIELLASRPVLGRLPTDASARLRELSAGFLGSKYLEGVQGLALEPVMSLRIAAWCCLPILNLGLDWYDDWNNIFVSPQGFSDRRWRPEAGGVITEWDDDLAGEVLELGPVVLSWQDVLDAGSGGGYNVVIHEMAHKLDARNGEMDGAPPLPRADQAAWSITFAEAWEDFCRRVDRRERRSRGHGRLPLDDYAAESPEEFFAVACENFFERPLGVKMDYPAVYERLVAFFGLDPASWI